MEEINNNIQLFENRQVRALWDENAEKWWLSVVDVIEALTESDNPQVYWRVLKKRLADEGNETVTNCNGLKMVAPDGKMRLTDVADTEQILRLIQSIPSKKAEPFKLWLAKVGSERIDETIDPELSQKTEPENLNESAKIAVSGAEVAKDARKSLEQRGGEVISSKNAKQLGKRELLLKD